MTISEALALSGAIVVLVLILYRPQLGLVALVAFYPFNGLVPRLPLGGLNSETILFTVALAVTLMRFGLRVPPIRYSGPLLAYLAVLLMALAIGAVGSREYRGTVLPVWVMFGGLKSITFTTLLFGLVYFWFEDRADRRRLLQAACVAVFFASVTAVIEFALSELVLYGFRIETLFENPNGLGVFLAGFGLVPLYLLRDSSSRSGRFFYLLSYFLGQVALILTVSRGAWLSTTVAHTIWFGLVNRQMLALGALALVLVATVAFPFLPDFLTQRITGTLEVRGTVFQVAGGIGGSGADRIVFYRVAADMFMDSPIWGHGLDGFFLLGPQYGARYGLIVHVAPHSLIVKLASEMGLLGLGVFGWIALTVLLCARDVWRRSLQDRQLGALLLASALALFSADLFHNVFLSVHQVSAFFWTLLACAVRELEESDAEAAFEDEEGEETDALEDEEAETLPAFGLTRRGWPPPSTLGSR